MSEPDRISVTNDDPESPEVRALTAIYEFLTGCPELDPVAAYDILLSTAGTIAAQYFTGDIEALIARAPDHLRAQIAQFTALNPAAVAAKRRLVQ